MVDKSKVLFLNSSFIKSDTTDGETTSITIEGYASTDDVDRQGDIVPASVWKKGIQNYLKNPVILAYHNHSEPVGRMVDHRVDGKGLWVKARISSAADEVFNLVKDGILTAFSIGFRIVDAEYDAAKELFVVKELELHEISIVSVPANQNTLFSLSKAFDTAEEFKSFKQQFAPESDSAKGLESSTEAIGEIKKEWEMDPKQLEQMLADAANKAAELTAKAIADTQAKQLAEKAAADKAEAELDARVKAAVASISTGDTGAERLMAEVEKRFATADESTKSVIAGLEASLKEKAAEIEAMTKSKMSFADTKNQDITYAEKEKAILLSKMTGKPVQETRTGRALIEKAATYAPASVTTSNTNHLPSGIWELEVSLNMENEIRRRLVVAPIFRNIAMQTNVMTMPVNPEAGTATWVQNTGFGASTSAGTTQNHTLKEITLNAYKVATNEYTAYEEEEDSLIALMPVIRDGMIRRVARAVDKAFLLGLGSGADPVKGISNWAGAGTGQVTYSLASTTGVTVANLRKLRQGLGAWGLDPQEVIYIVNTDIYYQLLDDPIFQTMNQVGTQATLLTGQIGQIGGSPVLVSAEYATPAATGTIAGAIAINPGNFLVGNQRGLRIDTQELVETQRRVMVASLRTGMTQVTTNNGNGVAKLTYVA
jgi:HK97 family phage prohead protease/HK97 family phage major capsid protein